MVVLSVVVRSPSGLVDPSDALIMGNQGSD